MTTAGNPANTGSTTTPLAWSRSDAALNLQRSGTATTLSDRKAQGITRVSNVDGSTTYTLDLTGLAANRAVLLSFDLLGFGPADSQVTLRNIQLSDSLVKVPTTVGDAVTTVEDTPITFNALVNDQNIDADVQPATLPTVVTGPAHGSVTVNADGSFTYTPHANYHGPDSVTYNVGPQTGGVSGGAVGVDTSNTSTVSINVTSVNDALKASVVAGPAHGSLTVNADGSFSYQAHANFFGEDSFTYTVGDGEWVSNVATVSINVAAVNDAPTVANQSLAVAEDTALAGQLLAANLASDVDSTTLVATVTTGPAHGTLTVNADGSFSYQAHTDYFGSDSFSYTVSDGALTSNTATVTLTVTPVNDAPTLGNQSLALAEDTVLTGNLLTTAADVDSTTLAALAALVVDDPAHGTLTVHADGSFIYTPSANYHGPDSFSYTVTDGQLMSNTAIVTITVTAVNDAPTVESFSLSTAEDTPVTINLIAGDADNTRASLQFGIQTGPTHGSLTLQADGSYVYTPNANYNGADGFTYSVNYAGSALQAVT